MAEIPSNGMAVANTFTRYFQGILGATPILSGVYLLPTALSLAFSSIGTGAFIAKKGLYLPPIYMGFFFMTLGWGLFINLDAHSSWAKIILYQIVAGLGTGPLFQAPIIALQAFINPRDIGTATATLGFIRQLATSTSVVIGEVVYQNQMSKKAGQLSQVLTPAQLGRVTGGNAGANTGFINQLPQPQKGDVREAFANSLQPMWIMYTCFAALGFLIMFLVKRKQLTREHEETKTGLEAEKANAEARAHDRESKRLSKLSSKNASKASVNHGSWLHRHSQVSLHRNSQAIANSQANANSRPSTGAVTEDSKEKDLEMGSIPPVPSLPDMHSRSSSRPISRDGAHTSDEDVPPVPQVPHGHRPHVSWDKEAH